MVQHLRGVVGLHDQRCAVAGFRGMIIMVFRSRLNSGAQDATGMGREE
jgi:hypothetical protein